MYIYILWRVDHKYCFDFFVCVGILNVSSSVPYIQASLDLPCIPMRWKMLEYLSQSAVLQVQLDELDELDDNKIKSCQIL